MQTIDEWLNVLKANGRTEGTIQNYRKALTRLQTHLHKPLEKVTKQDLIDYFANADAEDSTKVNWSIVIKKYYNEQGKPEIVSWLKLKKPNETLRPEDVPTPDDVNKMIDATDSPYWKAKIAFTYECGGRIEEVLHTTWEDFKDYKVKVGDVEETFLSVTLYDFKSKKYRQPMILPFSGQYIRNLKALTGGNPKDLVFKIRYRQTHAEFVKIGKKAGLPMNTSPHKLRHASATEMERRGFSDSVIRMKHGWTPASTTPSRYKHLSNQDVINETLVKNGVIHENAKEPVNIKKVEPNKVTDATELIMNLQNTLTEVSSKNSDIEKRNVALEEQVKSMSEELKEMRKLYLERLIEVGNEKMKYQPPTGGLNDYTPEPREEKHWELVAEGEVVDDRLVANEVHKNGKKVKIEMDDKQ